MKKTVALLAFVALIIGGVLYLKTHSTSLPVVRVVTWSGYFPDQIINEFTRKTGVRVELSYISSNEELFSKLKAGATGYDIIQPSDYMVEQMTKLDMLHPLDKNLLPHYGHLDPYYLNLPYDPGLKFTLPFVRGTTGVVVNTEKVKVPPQGIDWDFVLNSTDPTHTSLLDDMREVFAAALFKMGKSPNTTDMATLESASLVIRKAKGQIALFSSEPLPLLLRGDVTIAHAFSTHGIQAAVSNPKFKYLLPKSGNTVWTDNFAIPRTSPNIKTAHAFLDYFLDPDNAKAIVDENHLATPNKTARLKLSPLVQKDELLYPIESVLNRMVFLKSIDDGLLIMNRLWTDMKS